MQVDAERERISLGIKQLEEDPFNNHRAANKKVLLLQVQLLK